MVSGDIKDGKAPATLTPPSSKLVFKMSDSALAEVITHVGGLANVEIVWTVKKNSTNEVTPCGLAMVASKQVVCRFGRNTLS